MVLYPLPTKDERASGEPSLCLGRFQEIPSVPIATPRTTKAPGLSCRVLSAVSSRHNSSEPYFPKS